MTNATNTKRQRRMARQPDSNASGEHGAKASDTLSPDRQERCEANRPNKTDAVLALLGRKGGATLNQIVEATEWMPHSARAALTGLKKKGHAIERTKVDGISRYAIVEPVSQ